MKILFCLLAATALLCGCNKPAVSSPAAKTQWEYQEFEVKRPDATLHYISKLRFDQGWDASGEHIKWSSGTPCVEVKEVLNQIGVYGWDFCWRDGEKVLVKRPAGVFTNGNFVVFFEQQ
jgi:hypothetical protein